MCVPRLFGPSKQVTREQVIISGLSDPAVLSDKGFVAYSAALG